MTRPVVWSASSINSYNTCHLAWYLGYVLMEPGQRSEAMEVGIEVHDHAEKRLWWTRFQPYDTRMEAVMRAADREGTPLRIGNLADVFDRDILPTYRDPVLIEAPFQIEVDGVPFSGVIDSVDRQDIGPDRSALILRDLKTTGSRPAAGKYRLNMIGYWLGATDLGFPPDAMQLDYIVRTKHPYYWPEMVSVPDENDIARWANELHAVAGGVEKADYEPTGLGTYVCKFCPYRTICGPLLRYNAALDK